MDGSWQIRSLGRFLYTQNPFYLISCGLIIYGLQVATAGGDLHSRSALLALCMIGYTTLMSLTVVAVVRWGKVWEDARSIFLVVVIGQLALSAGLDLLCVDSWQIAARLMIGGFAFAVVSTEFVLRCCRIRFPLWYRLTYFFLLLAFYTMPVIAGYSVANNNLSFARWSAPIFSLLIALGMLLLVPAIRRGASYVHQNGTPWQWPWYPLSAFVVVVVVAAIRSHAIWMSFGSFSGSIGFEPFLLLPFAFAIFILIVEFARASDRPNLLYGAMIGAPIMLLLGIGRGGMTGLAIRNELQSTFGSATTLALLSILAFYLYLWMSQVRWSQHAVVISMLMTSFFADIPLVLQTAGAMPWMMTLVAALFYLGVCLQHRDCDRMWLALAAIMSIMFLQAGISYDRATFGLLVAAGWMLLSMMTIGVLFDSDFAEALRHVAAMIMLLATAGIVTLHFQSSPPPGIIIALAGMSIVAAAYVPISRRTGWLYLAALQSVLLLGLMIHSSGWTFASIDRSHWPIQSGAICFLIGVTITSVKTGVHRRISNQLAMPTIFQAYRSGF